MEKEKAERAHKIVMLMNKTQNEININNCLKESLKESDYSDGGRCLRSLEEFLRGADARLEANGMAHRVSKALYKRIWEAIFKHLDDDIAYLNGQIACGEKMISEL